jgi:hypothetical protein
MRLVTNSTPIMVPMTSAFQRSWIRGRSVFKASLGSTSLAQVVSLMGVMTHKYRGCIVVLSINKSVEPNEEQKVLISSFDQGITVNTSKQVFRSIW